MENISVEFIENLVCVQKKTHLQVSQILKDHFPDQKGFSERTVRRYCKEHDISERHGIDDNSLDYLVQETVSKVC